MSTNMRRVRRAVAGAALLVAASAVPVGVSGAADPEVAAPPVTEQSYGPVADWSTVTGTDGRVYFADAQGRALQLHGFNDKTSDPAATLTDEMLAAASERGLDHYRMTIYWQYIEPTQGNYDAAYLDSVITAIRRAEQHGIRTVLDMHQDVYGEAFGSHGAPDWATVTDGLPYEPQVSWLEDYLQPAVQRAFENLYELDWLRQAQIDAWLHVVEAVKDEPGVLGYDLMNEPFGEIHDGENLFTAAERVEREQITAMYQRLTDAISAVDPDHWIFIEPPNLASLGISTSLGPVNGPRVAFYPHMYDTSLEFSTYDPDSTDYTYDAGFFTNWASAITGYVQNNPMPMLVGEWGVARPESHSMDEYFREALTTMSEVTSGWSHFEFCFGSGYCSVDAEGNDRPNVDQIFMPYARAIAGAPTSSIYDFDTGELRTIYRDNGAQGPTEIFLPVSRTYPDGFRVLTSDADGAWSSEFDESTGVLSVSIEDTQGDHAICVVPEDSSVTDCEATGDDADHGDDAENGSGNGSHGNGGAGSAAPAEAVAARPSYTG